MIVGYQSYFNMIARRLQDGRMSEDAHMRCADKLMEWDMIEWEGSPDLAEAHDVELAIEIPLPLNISQILEREG